MSRVQRYVSLPREQIDFMRNNTATMTQKQMADKFGCSQGKVCENARLAGIVFPERNPNKPVRSKASAKIFNIDDHNDWMFGFKKGRVY